MFKKSRVAARPDDPPGGINLRAVASSREGTSDPFRYFSSAISKRVTDTPSCIKGIRLLLVQALALNHWPALTGMEVTSRRNVLAQGSP